MTTIKHSPTQWTLTAEEDPETGDIILPIPYDLMESQGWKDGDTLEWIDNNDGSWTIQKVDNGQV